MIRSIVLVTPCVLMLIATANAFDGQPVELGKINWHRSLDKGVQLAEQGQKPIFLLFQEVPGCHTCQHYGREVLSHPLIVEAIESLFVPVAIFNNKGGVDKEVLRYFREPAWNNPVVRIVNAQKENIVPRLSGNYTPLGVVQLMKRALKGQFQDVPLYLQLLEAELAAEAKGTKKAVFSMYCFWTGEKEIGGLEGVVETQAGFMNGREVVEVSYDPSQISYEALLEQAHKSRCADEVFTNDPQQKAQSQKKLGKKAVGQQSAFRPDGQPKYYLYNSVYRHVPMTQLQAARVNSLLGRRQLPEQVLSPRQQALVEYIRAHPNHQWPIAINQDFVRAWEKVEHQKS
ncbi:MAG: VPGUxxT family thioredoxin-like (seleno)protein, type 2 [Bacteroidota bacterium]